MCTGERTATFWRSRDKRKGASLTREKRRVVNAVHGGKPVLSYFGKYSDRSLLGGGNRGKAPAMRKRDSRLFPKIFVKRIQRREKKETRPSV